MEKIVKKTFRLLSLMLVFVLTLTATAVPAFAEPDPTKNLTITINNHDNLADMYDDQFTAYQIFKGDAHQDGAAEDAQWGATEWNNWTLANIEWGKDIQTPESLIKTLKELSAETDKPNWPQFFPEPGGTNVFADLPAYAAETPAASAQALADILAKHTTNAFLQEFSKFLVHGKTGAGENGFLNKETGTKSDLVDGNTNKSSITVTSPGYYLIVENGTHAGGLEDPANSAMSEFILAVLGNQTINLKASFPTVDKKIVTGEDPKTGRKDGDTAAVGDDVEFELKGTLPQNFLDFDKYKYIFHDTLSKGLTFKSETVEVTIKVGSDIYTMTPDSAYSVTSQPATTPAEGTHKDTNITVTFKDLLADLAYTKKGEDAESGSLNLRTELTKEAPATIGDIEIIVRYQATLNENAVIGPTGNPNDVYLEYSNNPDTPEDTGHTPKEIVYVYAFGLELTKIGSDVEHGAGTGLEGAGFLLSRTKDPGGKEYAKFTTGEDGSKHIKEWVVEATVKDLISKYNEALNKYNTAADPSTVESELESAKEGLKDYLLESGSKGKLPNVEGLDGGKWDSTTGATREASTYTLEEVITPDGYNTMDDVTITIEATINNDTGKLESVKYTSKGADGTNPSNVNTETYTESTPVDKTGVFTSV